jgi:hypothetical protein
MRAALAARCHANVSNARLNVRRCPASECDDTPTAARVSVRDRRRRRHPLSCGCASGAPFFCSSPSSHRRGGAAFCAPCRAPARRKHSAPQAGKATHAAAHLVAAVVTPSLRRRPPLVPAQRASAHAAMNIGAPQQHTRTLRHPQRRAAGSLAARPCPALAHTPASCCIGTTQAWCQQSHACAEAWPKQRCAPHVCHVRWRWHEGRAAAAPRPRREGTAHAHAWRRAAPLRAGAASPGGWHAAAAARRRLPRRRGLRRAGPPLLRLLRHVLRGCGVSTWQRRSAAQTAQRRTGLAAAAGAPCPPAVACAAPWHVSITQQRACRGTARARLGGEGDQRLLAVQRLPRDAILRQRARAAQAAHTRAQHARSRARTLHAAAASCVVKRTSA